MKLLKQAGTAVLASTLLLSYSPQAWANETLLTKPAIAPASPAQGGSTDSVSKDVHISKEKAIELAKTYINIPQNYTLQSVNLNSYTSVSSKPTVSWSLTFAQREGDRYLGMISISIDGVNGKLLNYDAANRDPDYKPSYPPKASYQQAKETAKQWIARIHPGLDAELLYNDLDERTFRTPLNGDYSYNIRFDRAVEGVPFSQDGISVSVNGEGEVTSYSYRWTEEAVFEKKGAPISQEKAEQLFKDKADISLVYQIPYESGERKPIISYTMNTFLLDAAAGELWSPEGAVVSAGGERGVLTEKPLGEKPAGDLQLTKEQAVERVAASFKLPEGAKLEDASYNEYTNPDTKEETASWNLRWSPPTVETESGKRMGGTIWAEVNSKTGEIANFNLYTDATGKKLEPKVSLDEAKQRAAEFVKKHAPAYTDQLSLDASGIDSLPADQLKEMRTWDIQFQRVIDGVHAGHEGVYVGVDRETGDIVHYSNSISSIPYPAQKPEVLPLEQAKERLLSQFDVKLMYVSPDNPMYPYGGGVAMEKYNLMVASGELPPGDGPQQAGKRKAKLVYGLVSKYTNDSFFLDAQTGQWKNAATGEMIALDNVQATDIAGHWAQNELQLMLDYQALDVQNEQAQPDQAITRGELIKMLVIAMNGGRNGIYYGAERAASFKDVANGSPYFAYVENAVDRGLIRRGADFNPQAHMNREEVAQLIVKALGYESLTAYEGIFNGDFADADQLTNRGQVAIVVGLHIMSLTDGRFQPRQEVTRAQAATAFYRYLQKRAELQERPNYYY